MKIAIAGANGYIGVRLIPLLLDEGHEVVCLVRDPERLNLPPTLGKQVQVCVFDMLEPAANFNLPTDIDAAYFLVHSMGSHNQNFEEMEATTARNFVGYINATTCKQIIFLSGLMSGNDLSPHMRSRKNVEDMLKTANTAHTILRAGIIIGSGSASFEIMRDIVEKLPVMVTPRWLNTKCQPIAIRDVLGYLAAVNGNTDCYNRTFDIGGNDVLTYRQMLLRLAKVRNLQRYIYSVPVLTPKLSSYWLYFVTSVSFPLAQNLVNSLKTRATVQDNSIRDIIPRELLSYEEAIELAFTRVKQNEVVSSWKDAFNTPATDFTIGEFIEVPENGCFIDRRTRKLKQDPEHVIENIWRLGGDNGWYVADLLWELRGVADKLVGGVGLRRGRRSPTDLHAGDALDFWRVLVADKNKGRLLLFAEMKLPGDAWLEFKIEERDGAAHLVQTATFRPTGISGRFYWYSIQPFHNMIFNGMADRIASLKPKKPRVKKEVA